MQDDYDASEKQGFNSITVYYRAGKIVLPVTYSCNKFIMTEMQLELYQDNKLVAVFNEWIYYTTNYGDANENEDEV